MYPRLIHKLSPFDNVKHIVKHDQSVGDIMQGILQTHENYKTEYDKIAMDFAGKTTREIAQKIWSYLKHHVKYEAEGDDEQFLKSPAAILATCRTTGSDCKNFSLFAGGILAALNRRGYKIPFSYRFASYRLNEKLPQHVFVVINPKTKNEIWLDPVLPQFDWHKQYYYSIDKKPKIALVSLHGVPDGRGDMMRVIKPENSASANRIMTIEGIFNKHDFASYSPSINVHHLLKENTDDSIGNFWKDAKKLLTKKGRKEFFKGILKSIKKVGKFILKFAASPVRNAFLLLVRFNFRSLATNLKKVIDAGKGDKIFDIFENFGGDRSKLKIAIGNGAKEKRLGEIGFAPAVAAAVPVASPLVLQVMRFIKPLLEKLGISKEDIEKTEQVATDAVEAKKKEVLDDIQKEADGKETQTGDKVVDDVKSGKAEGKKGFDMKYVAIAAAAAGALLLLKK
jgi:hypothetical protein